MSFNAQQKAKHIKDTIDQQARHPGGQTFTNVLFGVLLLGMKCSDSVASRSFQGGRASDLISRPGLQCRLTEVNTECLRGPSHRSHAAAACPAFITPSERGVTSLSSSSKNQLCARPQEVIFETHSSEKAQTLGDHSVEGAWQRLCQEPRC